ncbi:hypothetical protein A6A08_20150 [Nocardiopsis sp. TSRI0078]|uniref:hypothetical protein n=1 Tax=unclassified Nocardiopsis TaxID=2649073 RepID=UPI00093E0962|nr:hypothetical protein [Nocardiopsis sp. TSRI0078]OKI21905.1 hypothetical protein A6A08_20150 [Nocardiopsis sp. TSRI0078]
MLEIIDTIDAVGWEELPGPRGWYCPDHAASGLRALARARTLFQASDAGTALDNGGIAHGHSGAVFPAAAAAAPILLDIAEHGHPRARDTALRLLDDAMRLLPHAGHTRTASPRGGPAPICCAVAAHVRDRPHVLDGDRSGGSLLAEADAHWRFEVAECFADGGDGVALGALEGRLPSGGPAARLRRAGPSAPLHEVVPEYPPVDGQACLRAVDVHAEGLAPGTVLFPAECAEHVH